MTRILVYDRELESAERLRASIEPLHHWVVASNDQAYVAELLQKQFFHICIWPVECQADIDRLVHWKQNKPSTAFIATSSQNHSQLIVECMRAGTSQFWHRAEGEDRFREIVLDVLARVMPEEISREAHDFPLPQFVGRHPKILEIFELILSVKNSDSTVLITGESGTGKEVVARAIHDLSPRKRSPFVAVNCGAIPAALLESELFGHVKGAFTGASHTRTGRFQLARDGTLFLDEISDLPLDLQAKILRAIQQRTFEPVGSAQSMRLEARIIAATNQDLELAVNEKRFREDLFYRLNVIPIYIPALRSRKSDIPLLVKAFLDRFNSVNHKSLAGISEDAMRCLMQYHWPGNIRELENLVERVVVLKKDNRMIEMKDFPIDYFRNVRLDRFVANVALPEDGLDFNDAVNNFENELILQALQRTAGNKNQAATLLNLNRTTLVEKLKRKGLRIS